MTTRVIANFPCRLQDASAAEKADALQRFREVKEAYEVLGDGEAYSHPSYCGLHACNACREHRPVFLEPAYTLLESADQDAACMD